MITKTALEETTSQLTAGLLNIEKSLDDLSMSIVQKDQLSQADFIPQSLVDLSTFVEAASFGRGRKGMEWLEELEDRLQILQIEAIS